MQSGAFRKCPRSVQKSGRWYGPAAPTRGSSLGTDRPFVRRRLPFPHDVGSGESAASYGPVGMV